MYKHNKVREGLLQEIFLILQKTEEIRRTAGSVLAQMKVIGDTAETTVSAVNVEHEHQGHPEKAIASLQKQFC